MERCVELLDQAKIIKGLTRGQSARRTGRPRRTQQSEREDDRRGEPHSEQHPLKQAPPRVERRAGWSHEAARQQQDQHAMPVASAYVATLRHLGSPAIRRDTTMSPIRRPEGHREGDDVQDPIIPSGAGVIC